MRVAVITVSDSVVRGARQDTSGAVVAGWVKAKKYELISTATCADETLEIVRALLTACDNGGADLVLTTGGTGLAPRDVTPEAFGPLVTKAIPGFGELFRWLSYADIGASTIQSRAEAGLCGTTLVFMLPGSTGAVRLALEKIILPQLDSRTKPCNFVELLPRVRSEG